MSSASVPAPKRLSHRLKRAWYRSAALDAWVDATLCEPDGEGRPRGRFAREHLLYRLLPERRLRASPFEASSAEGAGLVRVLTLIPPEDTGGGSRPAQLAAELHRRGYAIQWRWALPIYPWPRRRRPTIPRVDAAPVDDAPETDESADLVLLAAPHPKLRALARDLPRAGPLLYDAIDVWDGVLGAGWYDREEEDRALAQADLLMASARPLRDELTSRTGRAVELLPNAIDLARFSRAGAASADLVGGAPTVIYVGALWGEWVDLELIEQLARRVPQAHIHLIGPPGDRRLPAQPNVHVHGPRPRDEIPGLLAAADVAIVPFAAGRLTAAISPLKVFEYLAMGRPVVSTRLPDLEGVPGVSLVDDTEAFVRAVRRAAEEPFPADAVREFLRDQTWARRVDRLLEITRLVR